MVGNITGVVFLGFGAFIFHNGFKEWQRKQLIQNTPTSTVRGLAMGGCEVFGKIAPYNGQLIQVPSFEAPCVFYAYKVEEYRKQGKSSKWVTIASQKKSVPFLLDDGTGQVLVSSPEKFDVRPKADLRQESGLFQGLTPQVQQFLSAINIQPREWFFNRALRVTISYFAPGDEVFILGEASDNPNVAEGSVVEGFRDVMISPGKEFNLISDKNEKEVLTESAGHVALKLVIGGLMVLAGLWLLLGVEVFA